MLKVITASCYKSMLLYGITHLDQYRTTVNELNVFPVPDGDTGTNMVMTMKKAYAALDDAPSSLSDMAQRFANACVFGARGNSGVILSQFFKGISEGWKDLEHADPAAFSKALRLGCDYAYAAVATPVEGTILTILREATEALNAQIAHLDSVDAVVDVFLSVARTSLANTPNLLDVLKKAGVVDGGGAGLVYFFEGVQRYLRGEMAEGETLAAAEEQDTVDFSAFNRKSSFDFGYCTEVLLQITREEADFDYAAFVNRLQGMGDSMVISQEGDKVKLHIHTKYPEQILLFCHDFGEFLSLKIENMSVQHSGMTPKFLRAPTAPAEHFSVVAVAPNAALQRMLADMGADVVILSDEVPSSQDFLEAFEMVDARDILVFPNSSNSILSAMQAGSLYRKAKITVLNCRSIAQCYATLPILDFEESDISALVSTVNETIGNIYEVSIVHATKNILYGDTTIVKNDYFALAGKDVLTTANQFEVAVLQTVRGVTVQRECGVLTMFYGKNVTEMQIEELTEHISREHGEIEISAVATHNEVYDLVLSFE